MCHYVRPQNPPVLLSTCPYPLLSLSPDDFTLFTTMADAFRFPSPPPGYRNHGVPDPDFDDEQDASRQPLPSNTPRRTALTPYLTLPHLLSLTWLAYPILSLLFVAFRLIISSASAQDAVVDAKGQLMTSCEAAERAASVAASLPRYMAEGTNGQIIDAVNASMAAARTLTDS